MRSVLVLANGPQFYLCCCWDPKGTRDVLDLLPCLRNTLVQLGKESCQRALLLVQGEPSNLPPFALSKAKSWNPTMRRSLLGMKWDVHIVLSPKQESILSVTRPSWKQSPTTTPQIITLSTLHTSCLSFYTNRSKHPTTTYPTQTHEHPPNKKTDKHRQTQQTPLQLSLKSSPPSPHHLSTSQIGSAFHSPRTNNLVAPGASIPTFDSIRPKNQKAR